MLTEEVDRNRADWKKGVLGPYKILLQSETYKKDVAEWEIGNWQLFAYGRHSSQDESQRSWKSALHAAHCASLSCTVVSCVSPHSGHLCLSLLHGAPHPSHRTLPHNHCN